MTEFSFFLCNYSNVEYAFAHSHGTLLLSSDLSVGLKHVVSCLHLSKWSAAVTLAQTQCCFMFPLKSQHSTAVLVCLFETV